jgi:glutathione synthase/RimK-type ligase-like ATP-grasp enzyme
MKNTKALPRSEAGDAHAPLMGNAALMSMAYAGIDLAPLGVELVGRASADPSDANAFMDLATIMQLDLAPDVAMDLQAQALQIQQRYILPAAGKESIRLLALLAPGELMANAPLEFLVDDSDITLEMLYVSPELPVPTVLPEHDVLFVAVNESDANRPVLELIATLLESSSRLVLNAPQSIAALSRAGSWALLRSAPGLVMPESVRVEREVLEQLGGERLAIDAVLNDDGFPIIVRPLDSHAGRGLRKLDEPAAVAAYVQAVTASEFYVSPFIDYRSADGLYRKYRIVLIDGRPYACHMALSTKWMVHYLNAGMADSAVKRAEEAQWMASFDEDFALRHAQALRAIAARMRLDYLVIDCAETDSGELLVFEVDSGAVVHAMDPVEVFPYKAPQMRKIFAAFRELLLKAQRGQLSRDRDSHDHGA